MSKKIIGFDELLKLAKKQKNFVTYDSLNKFIPNMAINPDLIDDIFILLSKHKVEVVDNLSDRKKKKKKKTGVDDEFAGFEDSIKMYLKEIGKIELLDPNHEIKLAQKIEEGRMDLIIVAFTYG